MKKIDPVNILLIEDNPVDVDITREGLEESKIIINLDVVSNGVEALNYLRNKSPFQNVTRPDLIILDLNMPKMDGRELLNIIKKEDNFKSIPVIVLTTSKSEQDIISTYNLHVNAFLTKPIDFEEFIQMMRSFDEFWLTFVKLPPK